jgi:hypothetical protein
VVKTVQLIHYTFTLNYITGASCLTLLITLLRESLGSISHSYIYIFKQGFMLHGLLLLSGTLSFMLIDGNIFTLIVHKVHGAFEATEIYRILRRTFLGV